MWYVLVFQCLVTGAFKREKFFSGFPKYSMPFNEDMKEAVDLYGYDGYKPIAVYECQELDKAA